MIALTALLDDEAFEVAFRDNQGRTYATLALKADQLTVLHHEPVA